MSETAGRYTKRALALTVCGVGLYIVAPSLLTMFDSWPRLGDVRPRWFVLLVLLEAASFASLWLLLRIALPGGRWLDIVTSQLASNAASRIIPGGAASGAVVQARMLIRSGHSAGAVSAVLSATGLLTTGVLLALPVIAVPAVLLGRPLAHELEVGLVVSLVVAALLVGLGLALLKSDRLVLLIGKLAGHLLHLVRRRIDPTEAAARFLAERDQVASAFRDRWLRALACAVGNRMFDYATLAAALMAVGAEARPSLVLVAYVASIALALVPITPGGLGIVEAGLTTLLVLAGVTPDQAIVGTLLYRLVSFWLPIPVGAVAWLGWRLRPRRPTAGSAALVDEHETLDDILPPTPVTAPSAYGRVGSMSTVGSTSTVDRRRLRALVERERATFETLHPRSGALFRDATHLFGRVPMTWMGMWSGGFPIYLDHATGNRVVDVDGHEYVDFALGDTGAMAGHRPQATIDAITERISTLGGITTMLPTADAEWVGAELTRRFGLPLWSFTLSATDANRWAIRLARLATRRPRILTFAYCYHGSVDEAFALAGPNGQAVARPGNVGQPVSLDRTTRVAEFNDLADVEAQLAHGDVAAILTEPALTNIGIVLPQPGFMDGLRDLATTYGALLMIDETHTFSAGPGGATRLWNLKPDILVIGKSIGGGIPSGAYGITNDLADQVDSHPDADLIDVGGIGGTLAGNPLSVAAMRATLEHVLTDDAFASMVDLSTAFTAGVQQTIDRAYVPWSVTQLGARSEYRFASPAPTTGTESNAAGDQELDEYLHLYLLNRGVLVTPFHNMALMCPDTTRDDVDLHTRLFASAVDDLEPPS